MLNDIFLLQTLSLLTLFFFINTFNIISLWYLAGLYLVFTGLWLFLDDGDIFIGFLWVIDLGVGLVFFIFILHYSNFLHHKVTLDKGSRELIFWATGAIFLMSLFFFLAQPCDSVYLQGFQRTWFFLVTWYDYYEIFWANTVTDLNLLREIYFFNNSLEFFMINFVLFYGIIGAILLTFLIKRVFMFANLSQATSYQTLMHVNATYFIRNQNFLKQHTTSSGTRVWAKRKYLTKNDL